MFCVPKAVYVPADDYTDPAPVTIFSHLDATITLDRAIVEQGLYPAVNNGDVLSYEIFIPDEETLNRVTSIYQQADKSESVCHLSIHDLINSINYN